MAQHIQRAHTKNYIIIFIGHYAYTFIPNYTCSIMYINLCSELMHDTAYGTHIKLLNYV